MAPPNAPTGLARHTVHGRGALAAVTLGSAMALLDGTVVTIALRPIGTDLGASLPQLQWMVGGYLLSLSSLILVAGALADRLGRRRIYLLGVGAFAVASVLCAMAQDPTQLILARLLQGVGGALLTPGALAIISASFRAEDRSAAIGTWAGYSGVATAIGPFLGGFLLDHGGWRGIFAVNVPVAALVVVLTVRFVPESRDVEGAGGRFDVIGAGLTALGLAALTYGLTGAAEQPVLLTWGLVSVGAVAFGGFVAWERGREPALVPLTLFASRIFSTANAMTFLVYAALGAVMFFLVIQLQVAAGFSPLESGLATLPVTVALMLLSSRFAALSRRTGPRLLMAVGPILCAVGVLLLAWVGRGTTYWVGVFPGMCVFALGLAMLVSPLTAAVLAAIPNRHAGIASGVNNAVARVGSLLAVAALPALVGVSGSDYADADAFTAGYRLAAFGCAALLAAGGVVSWIGIPPGPMDDAS